MNVSYCFFISRKIVGEFYKHGASSKYLKKKSSNKVINSSSNNLTSHTIPGIGPVYASGILSEIGSISDFNSDDALANFAGLTWKKTQSGSFDASDTPMQKNGNSYLRYYLIEATQNIISNIPSYKEYFDKKKSEVTTHAYSRARVLTARKVLRLIYSLVSQNKLYQPK